MKKKIVEQKEEATQIVIYKRDAKTSRFLQTRPSRSFRDETLCSTDLFVVFEEIGRNATKNNIYLYCKCNFNCKTLKKNCKYKS